jgi:RNA polymerase sigma factor (sigma-70 family)
VAALQRIPPRDRLIVVLRYGLGETSAEIGRQVGLSDSGVRVRLSRVLAQLREVLEDE